jgi:fecR protein
MKEFQSHQIARIILCVRYGIATGEEKRLFEVWIKGKGRQALYDKIVADESLKEHLDLKSGYDRQTDYGKLQSDILRSLTKRNRQKQVKRYFLWCGSAAAVLILASMLLFKYMKDAPVEMYPKKLEIAKILPASATVQDKVILVLADGEKVGMTKIEQDSLHVGMAVVMGQEDKLIYASDRERADSTVSEKLEMNKVITTTGGFYSLVLSDGTRVWLNSESEFEFPVLFGKGERRVKLEGEAFFEVTPDAARPFIVQASGVRTRVLGTSFNIKAYTNESDVTTTLFTGKVDVASLTDTTGKVILSPGRQANWNQQTGKLRVSEANLDNVIAWKEGMFVFNKENIEVVTRQIERWYGVKFIYDTGGKKDYTFNGYFSKDETLKSILDAFTFTGGPEFKIEGNVVHVRDRSQ